MKVEMFIIRMGFVIGLHKGIATGHKRLKVVCDRTTYIITEVGPCYPLGTISTVPSAYDILGPMREWKGEKIKIKNEQIGKCNTRQNTRLKKNIFFFKNQNTTVNLRVKW
jgi:hypothetical protein